MALSKTSRLAVYAIGFIASLYLLQWILQLIFNGMHSDPVAIALRPLQNHYFSFSKYYITTEGSLGEFTNDITGVGRMLGPLILGGIIWVVLSMLSTIKPLAKYSGSISLSIGILILISSLYTSFFAPPRKTTFLENEIVVEKSDQLLGFTFPFSKQAKLNFSAIDKIEYDFYADKDAYGNALLLQIYIVVGKERFLIGENQVDSNSTYVPSDEQKQEAQKLVDVLSKLIGKSVMN